MIKCIILKTDNEGVYEGIHNSTLSAALLVPQGFTIEVLPVCNYIVAGACSEDSRELKTSYFKETSNNNG